MGEDPIRIVKENSGIFAGVLLTNINCATESTISLVTH